MGFSKTEHKLPLQVLEELALDQKPTIVMSEGHDPRIISGAIAAYNAGICQIVLLGSQITIKAECENLGLNLPIDINIIDPRKSNPLQCKGSNKCIGLGLGLKQSPARYYAHLATIAQFLQLQISIHPKEAQLSMHQTAIFSMMKTQLCRFGQI